MPHRLVRSLAAALTLLLAVAACSRRPSVLVPPTVELAPHAALGIVAFTSEGAQKELAPVATQRFAASILAAQPGNAVLEIGSVTGPIDAAAARRLGSEHGVRSIFVGHLVVSDVKPRVTILGGLSARADATISLTVRLMSTETGATLWTRSSRLTETLGGVGVVNGQAVLDASDPEETYGAMVDRLVRDVTYDFRSTWVRQ